MNIKVELWNDHEIRFVETEPGEWGAVGVDAARALGYANPSMAVVNHCEGLSKIDIPSAKGLQETTIIPEEDIYELVFVAAKQSRSPAIREKAKAFKKWVFETIKLLRQASGLEAHQALEMLDKEHQKRMMGSLSYFLNDPKRQDFMKANTITNKAVSTKFGYEKLIKKGDMTQEMLDARQPILEDTVNLMTANESFGLGISVSQAIYNKYCQPQETLVK